MLWDLFRRRENRVGVLTCTYNEVACCVFSLGAFVQIADACVVVDTGSSDGTVSLIRELFPSPIEQGRLIIEQVGKLPDHDISIARNRGLELLRELDIHYVLKIDADDVFYDAGARALVDAVRHLAPEVTHVSCKNRELYQADIAGTREWLEALKADRPVFWEMSFVPLTVRGYAMKGTVARGKWADEARTGVAEGLFVPLPHKVKEVRGVLGAHYGWARPVEKKREKISIWCGDPAGDPRVDQLHVGDDWRKPRRRFTEHPEVIGRHIDRVTEWFVNSTVG